MCYTHTLLRSCSAWALMTAHWSWSTLPVIRSCSTRILFPARWSWSTLTDGSPAVQPQLVQPWDFKKFIIVINIVTFVHACTVKWIRTIKQTSTQKCGTRYHGQHLYKLSLFISMLNDLCWRSSAWCCNGPVVTGFCLRLLYDQYAAPVICMV